MAGALSGHLLHTFNNTPAQPSTPAIVTSGAMSFDARAHGTPAPSMPPFFIPSPSPFGFSPLAEDSATAKQIATLQAKLNKKLGPEYISQRPGPGGGPKLTYAEGWKVINLANEVFGFNGWSSSIVSIVPDFVDHNEATKRFDIGVTAIVRVTLRDGAFHEDVGYGMMENVKSKGAGLDKCKKEAITDALKRTLRNFGNLLGNCLYDKAYAQEVVKIKVPPARFDKTALYRRPEFEERIPNAAVPVPVSRDQAVTPEPSSSKRDGPRIKVENEGHQPETPITYVPRHLRQEMAAAAQAQGSAGSPVTPSRRAPTPPNAQASTSGSASRSGCGAVNILAQCSVDTPKTSGLATPIQTPMQAQRPPPPQIPPPRAVATSPLAQVRSASGRGASISEPAPMSACAGSTASVDNVNASNTNSLADDDDDAFPLSTQDGALFAAVDLGDSDLGRPIDYEEGMGGVTMMDDDGDVSALEQGSDNVAQSRATLLHPQVRERAWSDASSSGGPSTTNKRTEVSALPAAKNPLSISGNGNVDPIASRGQPQAQSGTPNVASTSSMHAGLPAQETRDFRLMQTPTGGFQFPAGVSTPQQQRQQAQKHAPKPVMPPHALKRSADVMQAGSSSSAPTRSPIQSMGLAQRQHQQHQNAIARESSDNEGDNAKRIRR